MQCNAMAQLNAEKNATSCSVSCIRCPQAPAMSSSFFSWAYSSLSYAGLFLKLWQSRTLRKKSSSHARCPGTLQYNAMQCNAMQCNAMQWHSPTLEKNAMSCSVPRVRCPRALAMPSSSIMQCSAVQYNTLQYNAMQCNAMQWHSPTLEKTLCHAPFLAYGVLGRSPCHPAPSSEHTVPLFTQFCL